MLARQNSLHHETAVEIIARNYELRGFTRGQETPVTSRPDATKRWKIATVGKALADRAIKQTWSKMRHEREHDDGEFLDAWFVRRYEAREP
jgi:hypothetical protein